MLQFRRLKALVRKETYQIFRDASSVLISVFLPFLLIFLYGFGISLDLDHVKVGLVLEDTSPEAQSFAQSLKGSRYFDVTVVRERQELGLQLTSGALRGIIVVPSYFTQYLYRLDKTAPIQVIADGSETNTSNFVVNYAQGVFQNWLIQQGLEWGIKRASSIDVQPRYWYNPELESHNFLIPGSLAIIMTLVGAMLTALVVAREWERGTMESMISTPVTKSELIMGKVIPYFVLGIVSLTLCVLIAIWGFNVPFRGSYWLLYLSSSIFLFCSLSFGLMVSTLAKNQVVAYQIALVAAFLPSYILSGFLFEISSMPEWIQWLTCVIFAKYYVQSLQTIFLVGNVWEMIFWNMVPMVVIGALFFFITAAKTTKRLD